MSDTEKKQIIIDEDWKSQVQTEKERAQATTGVSETAAADNAAQMEQSANPVPAATLEFLINTLTSQALFFLGLIPNPATNEAQIVLPQAKHFIDMIEVVQQKTHGNCTGHEAEQMKHSLTQLRLIYLEVANKAGK